MALNFKKFWKGLKIVPKAASESDSQGDIEVLSTDGKARFHNGTSNSPLVTEAHTATLTNKSIDADTNTITNIENADIKALAAIDASKLADGSVSNAEFQYLANVTSDIQTQLNTNATAISDHLADLTDAHDASAISITSISTIVATDVQGALAELQSDIATVGSDLGAHIVDAIDAHDASAVSNVPSGNLAATDVQGALNELQTDIDGRIAGPASATDNAIVRFDGITGKLSQDSVVTVDDVGVTSGITQLNVDNLRLDGSTISSTSAADMIIVPTALYATEVQGAFRTTGYVAHTPVDNTASGANQTLTINGKNIRLTGALTSIDMMIADAFGKEVTLINRTGGAVTINHDTGGTAAYRIYTGTGTAVTLEIDAAMHFVYDGTTQRWNIVGGTGSGSGTGGINYIDNSDFEANATGWVTYADAAGVAPVDGTGGAANITFAQSTSSPLRGTASGLLTKDAVDRQGEGFSYDFTIDSTDQTKLISVSFDYETSANYADADMLIYVYDVTNSRLIEVIDRDLNANAQGSFSGIFQASPDSTSYRLIFHISSTSALDYTVKIDNVIVGPKAPAVKGAIVTDWEDFTPTGTWVSGNETYTGNYRRVGSDIEVQYKILLTGAPTNAELDLNLPSGLVIDTDKLKRSAGTSTEVGSGKLLDGGSTIYDATVVYASTTSVRVRVPNVGGTYLGGGTPLSSTVPFTWASGDEVNVTVKVPISGWSSNVALSEDNSNREIIARGTGSTTNFSVETTLVFTTSETDTTASYNTSTGEFTVPETGYYDISTGIRTNAVTLATNQALSIQLYVDGVIKAAENRYGNGASASHRMTATVGNVYAEKGVIIKVTGISSLSTTLNGTTTDNFISIAKRSSPQTIAASEKVYVRATTNSGSAVGTSFTLITYEDKEIDTHNAYTSGVFTAPSTGYYKITAAWITATVTIATTGTIAASIYVNGVSKSIGSIKGNGASTTTQCYITDYIYLSKGDTVSIYGICTTATTVNNTSPTYNYLSIIKD